MVILLLSDNVCWSELVILARTDPWRVLIRTSDSLTERWRPDRHSYQWVGGNYTEWECVLQWRCPDSDVRRGSGWAHTINATLHIHMGFYFHTAELVLNDILCISLQTMVHSWLTILNVCLRRWRYKESVTDNATPHASCVCKCLHYLWRFVIELTDSAEATLMRIAVATDNNVRNM